MKKLLLAAMLLLSASYGMQAQTTFYPNGSQNSPTWYYSDIIDDNSGVYYNPKTGKDGTVLQDGALDFTTSFSNDIYDGAFEFFVNIEDSVYTESGLVDTTFNTFTLGEQLINGLYVSKSYYFNTTQPVVRVSFKIRNPSGTAKSAKIGVFTNLGSDNYTQLDSSSTDGSSLSNSDRWMITTDGSGGTDDPVSTFARFGPGTIASTPKFGSKPEIGNDDYLDTFAVNVPANSYSLILQFHRMDTTIAAARANTVKLNTVAALATAGYLQGMLQSDLGKVVNWDISNVAEVYTGVQTVTDVTSAISIYPVPASQNVHIGLGDAIQGATTIHVKDMSGVTVLSKNTSKGAGTFYETMDVSALEAGMYIVEIRNNDNIAYKKLIKN